MSTAKKMAALAVCVGLLVAAGCSQEKVQNLEKSVVESRAQVMRLTAELGTAELSLEQKEAELTATKAAQAQTIGDLTGVKEQLEEADAAAVALLAQVAKAQQKAADADQVVAEANQAMESAEAQHEKSLRAAQAQIGSLKQQVADLTVKLAEAQKKALEAMKKEEPPERPPEPSTP